MMLMVIVMIKIIMQNRHLQINRLAKSSVFVLQIKIILGINN